MKQIHLELALLIVAPFVLFLALPRYYEALTDPSGHSLPDQNPPEFSQPPPREAT